MKITLIHQLIGFKKYELENLAKDYQTLTYLVGESSRKLEEQERVIEEYRVDYLNSMVSNSSDMLSYRQYLEYLVAKKNILQKEFENAEAQRDAAFIAYKRAIAEIKLNEKLLVNREKQDLSEQVINGYKLNDDLELMRFNYADSQ